MFPCCVKISFKVRPLLEFFDKVTVIKCNSPYRIRLSLVPNEVDEQRFPASRLPVVWVFSLLLTGR